MSGQITIQVQPSARQIGASVVAHLIAQALADHGFTNVILSTACAPAQAQQLIDEARDAGRASVAEALGVQIDVVDAPSLTAPKHTHYQMHPKVRLEAGLGGPIL